MNLDIDYLIHFFKKNTITEPKQEFSEQDAAPSGGGGKAMPTWAGTVGGPARGPANMLGKKGEKWDTGIKRGVANQVW
jgi:hypothetical protein